MALVAEAMGSLVPKLTELLKEEYKLQTGVREKINFLKNELEDMHAALRKVGDMHPDLLDEQVRIWARKVRELSYDMEDVIDAFLVRVDGREPANPGCLERLVHMMCGLFTKTKVRHQISGIVQDINTKLQEVSKARERYIASDLLANPAATQSSTHDPRILSLNTDATELVGIDGPRNDIIKILSLEGDDVPLGKMIKVSIVGSGGMGKTTLAKAVYDSVKGKFQCSAFVPVGQNQDLKRVFMDILNDLDKEKFDNIHSTKKDVRLLMKEVYEFLENKRDIIAIDDIWKFDAWDMIANVLGDSSCGSRVIVTTRISEIAEEIGHVYEIKQLSDVDSRMLLHRRILSGEDQCPDDDYDLEEVCDEILRKCEGVPLAIVTTSSLLESKPREDWSELYRSIGLGAKDNRHVDNTMKILSLSYYHLPYHLRTCLLYLSAFPEDYVIGKQTLIWRWIGEGFVCKEEGRDLYEVGESYFNELVKRRMIMPIEAENEDYVLGCRVHDMVLGLIRSLSSSENFVTLLGIEQYNTSHQGYGRRISILSSKIGLPPVANLGTAESQVRSFSANGLSYIDVLPLPAPAKFEAVRVLALQNCESLQDLHHLEYVGSLLHLRYLALTNSPLSELPNGIGGHLRFLETLDLWGTGIEQVPSSVGKLTQLLCLQADIKTRVPDWIGNLTSLQELWMWPDAAAAGQFVKELGKMKDLRVLCTQFMGASASDVIESLRSLRKIQKVHTFDRWAVVGQCVPWEQGFITPQCLQFLCLRCLIFTNLPPWINPSLLPNLSNLSLSLQVLRQADMEILGRLRVLRRLELFAMGSAIIRIGIHDTLLFRKLRFCTMATTSIRFVSTVPPPVASAAITTPVSVMPCLELLHFSLDVHFFKDCNLAFDIGLEHLPSSLRTVKVFVLCHLANEEDVKEAEAALLHSVSIHPSRPDLQLERLAEDKMVPSHLKDDQ